MSVAVDGSTPVAVTGNPNTGDPLTTASFTAPTDALLVAILTMASDVSDMTTHTFLDSGSLTWTSQIVRAWTEASGNAHLQIWTAATVSSVARTVTLQRNGSDGGNSGKQARLKVYVLTGADTSGPLDSVGANNENSSTTNNLTTTTITAGRNGMLFVGATNSVGGGAGYTSSDLTIDQSQLSEDFPVETFDFLSGYKSVSSGDSVNANLDAQGSGAVTQDWVQIIVREPLPSLRGNIRKVISTNIRPRPFAPGFAR